MRKHDALNFQHGASPDGIPPAEDGLPVEDELREGTYDEGSVEDVLEQLKEHDRLLREAQQIDPTAQRVYDFELSERGREELAHLLRSVWTRLGLHDADQVTADRLTEISSENLEELNEDEFAAESIYFDTLEKTWKKLGAQQVTADRIMAQLAPQAKASRPTRAVSVGKIRDQQGESAADYLRKIKVDSDELLAMVLGSSAQRQNMVRLTFLLENEPSLRETRKFLNGDSDEPRPETITVDDVLDRSVRELAEYMRKYMDQRAAKGATNEWEAIDYEQYNRLLQSAFFSLKLIDRIRKDMKNG